MLERLRRHAGLSCSCRVVVLYVSNVECGLLERTWRSGCACSSGCVGALTWPFLQDCGVVRFSRRVAFARANVALRLGLLERLRRRAGHGRSGDARKRAGVGVQRVIVCGRGCGGVGLGIGMVWVWVLV